jgi:hypothetical protein
MAEVHLPHAAGSHRPDDNPAVHHETSDVNIRGILIFAAGLAGSAVVIAFVVLGLFKYFDAREARRLEPQYPLAAASGPRLPPEPRLQTSPREDLRALHAQEEQVLNSYGWVDRNAGVARIPIEEAMKLVVQRGLPSRQPNDRR